MEETQKKKDYFLPAAIVIAALVIGAAVIYSSGKSSSNKPQNSPAANAKELKISDSDRIFGDKKAELTIFEFSDYECPFCAKYHKTTRQEIVEKYVKTGKVKLVFRDMPFHSNSLLDSESAWCAADQNKYWEMHDAIFNKKDAGEDLNKDAILKIADSLVSDKKAFSDCLTSEKYKNAILDVMRAGQALGINATPISVIIKKSSVNVDPNQITSELQKNNYIIQLDGGAVVVGAQPFSVVSGEIEKLLK